MRVALRRIHLGTFGICLDCEEEINLKRLAALPWTSSCPRCRQALDRNPTTGRIAEEGPLLEAA